MSDAISPLRSYQKNHHSQCGEDGVIEEILRRIGAVERLDKWCVEFGAWDGIHLSNAYSLIQRENFKAVLIEGDSRKYEELCQNIPSENVIKIHKFVNFAGPSSLEGILKSTPIPSNFDFLSIDIDGCDYFIFESLIAYRPKIVCIEFNHTIPNEVEFIQPKAFSVKQGSSAKSLSKLAAAKGYSLVAATACNLFFVDAKFKEAVVGAADVTLESLRDDSEYKSFIFCGMDGTVITSKSELSLPWHGISFSPARLQQLPRYLRKFRGDYSLLQKITFMIFLLFRFPKSFRGFFSRKLLQPLIANIRRNNQ